MPLQIKVGSGFIFFAPSVSVWASVPAMAARLVFTTTPAQGKIGAREGASSVQGKPAKGHDQAAKYHHRNVMAGKGLRAAGTIFSHARAKQPGTDRRNQAAHQVNHAGRPRNRSLRGQAAGGPARPPPQTQLAASVSGSTTQSPCQAKVLPSPAFDHRPGHLYNRS